MHTTLWILVTSLMVGLTSGITSVRTSAGDGNLNVTTVTDIVACDTSGTNQVQVTLPLVVANPTFSLWICDETLNAGNNAIVVRSQPQDTVLRTRSTLNISLDGACFFFYNDGVNNWATNGQ